MQVTSSISDPFIAVTSQKKPKRSQRTVWYIGFHLSGIHGLLGNRWSPTNPTNTEAHSVQSMQNMQARLATREDFNGVARKPLALRSDWMELMENSSHENIILIYIYI